MNKQTDLVGKKLGPYQITAQVGRGSISTVYKAVKPPLERYVAIKVLVPRLCADRKLVQDFSYEAQVLAKLNHRHVITIHDVGEADGQFYIVMEYLHGRTLEALLEEQEPLTLAGVSLVVWQIADALDYAHRREMLHRNVKPSNVVIETREGEPLRAVLTDFGLVKPVSQKRSTASTVNISGTPEYMAPETIESGQVHPASDLYALSVMAFEMLTGQVPFTGNTIVAVWNAQVHNPPPKVTTLRPDLLPAVDAVLARALSKDPADRFPTGLAFAQALGQAMDVEVPAEFARRAIVLDVPQDDEGQDVGGEAADLERLTALRQLLVERFSQGELRTLCFDLGLDYDDLPGQGKADKARELLEYLDHRCAVQRLVKIGRQSRSDIDWEGVLGG